MPYDPATDVGKVRLLTADTDDADPIFSDAEIQAFLTMEGDSVLLAAALALDTIANSETLVQKRITLLDLSTDGPSVARALREGAANLRRRHLEADGADGLFDWAEMVPDAFSARERLRNQYLRGAV